MAAELEGRDRRAAERRMTAAHLPVVKTLEAFDFAFQPSLSERLLWEWPISPLCRVPRTSCFSDLRALEKPT